MERGWGREIEGEGKAKGREVWGRGRIEIGEQKGGIEGENRLLSWECSETRRVIRKGPFAHPPILSY